MFETGLPCLAAIQQPVSHGTRILSPSSTERGAPNKDYELVCRLAQRKRLLIRIITLFVV
jgi:hypothetical protein